MFANIHSNLSTNSTSQLLKHDITARVEFNGRPTMNIGLELNREFQTQLNILDKNLLVGYQFPWHPCLPYTSSIVL